MESSNSSERVGFRTLLLYAQGQLGLNLCSTLLGLHLLYFYTDRERLAPAAAGFVIFLALGIDALTDPIVGNISDRARFRSGRRRPFFIAGALPMALFFFLLLSPPHIGGGILAWFFVCYFLMLTSRKFYETAFGALMPELTLDYDKRTRLSTFRQLFGTCGDITGSLLPFGAAYLFARGLDFRVTGVVAALLVAGGATAAFLGTRERSEFAETPRNSLVASLRSAMDNRPFLILLGATTLAIMAVNVPGTLMRFLAKYWMHDEGAAARWLIAYFVGSVISYPFWFRITVAIEKKPAFVVAMLCNVAGSLLFMLMTPANHFALYALMLFSGFSAIGVWVTQIAASADVIEWDQERTGMRQEGAYGGIMSMSVKLALAMSFLAIGPLLGWVGYVPGGADMTPVAAENLRRLFVFVPASIYLMSALVFSRYRITRKSHREMRERLAAREATQAAKAATGQVSLRHSCRSSLPSFAAGWRPMLGRARRTGGRNEKKSNHQWSVRVDHPCGDRGMRRVTRGRSGGHQGA